MSGVLGIASIVAVPGIDVVPAGHASVLFPSTLSPTVGNGGLGS